MESIIQSLDSQLLDRLDFNLASAPVAKYITRREAVTFHATGASEYSPNGLRTIRLNISGSQGDWLDPSTTKLVFTLKSTHTSASTGANIGSTGTVYAVTPRASPITMFTRCRLISGNGVILEDIQSLGRVAEAMSLCTSPHVRELEQSQGWGSANHGVDGKSISFCETLGDKYFGAQAYIAQGQEKTVVCSLPLGLFTQSKFLPLTMGTKGFTVELECAPAGYSVHSDYIIKYAPTTTGGTEWTPTYNIKANESGSNCNYVLLNPMIKADVITLDSSVQDKYMAHLMSGGALNIAFQGVASMVQSITPSGGKASVSLTRTASCVKSILISLLASEPPEGFSLDGVDMGELLFWGPGGLSGKDYNNDANTVKYQVQVGSKVYPVMTTTSGNAENISRLLQAMGIHSSPLHGCSFNLQTYSSTALLLGADMERALESSFSGLSTRNSENVVVRLEGLDAAGPQFWGTAAGVHVILLSDNILAIKDGGCDLLE